MTSQEFVDNLQDFIETNNLVKKQVTPVGKTSALIEISGDRAKQLLSEWLAELKELRRIIYYSAPEIDQLTLNTQTFVSFDTATNSTFAGYAFHVYPEYYEPGFCPVICDTLQEAIKEMKSLNKLTDLNWKLSIIKPV